MQSHESNRTIVTRVANGTSLITVSITAVPSIETQATGTAS